MANFQGINIPLNYVVEGQKQVEQVKQAVEKLSTTTTKLQGDVNKLTNAFTNGFNQSRVVIQGMKEAYGAFDSIFGKGLKTMMSYELELAKIQGVLASQGKDTGMVDTMERLAGQMSKQSFFKKGEILGVERLIMTFESMTSTTLPQATAAAVGLATVMDVDLRSAALALGKALESPAEGMKALRRMGVILNEDDKERIKLLEEQGLKYEAQQVILSAVEKKYKDVYDAIKDTDAFQLAQAEKALMGIQKNAAAMELQFLRPMLGVIEKAAIGLSKLAPEVQAAIGLTMNLTAAYALLTTTGLGATIKSLLFMGPSIKSLTVAQLENVIMTRQMTAAQGAEALAAYEAALANKAFFASLGPAGWALMALTALVPVLYTIGSVTDENAEKQEEYNSKLQKMNAKQMQVQLAGVGGELAGLQKQLEGIKTANSNIAATAAVVKSKTAEQLDLEDKIAKKKKEQNDLMKRQRELADDIKKASTELDDELEILAQGNEKERSKTRDKKWYEKKKEEINLLEAAEANGKKVTSPEMIKRLRDNLEKAYKNKQGEGGSVRRESQTGSESMMEQLREEVKNTESIEVMYKALLARWVKIDTLSVKTRGGKVDDEATKNQREKMKGQSADIVQQELQRVLRDKMKMAEIEAELAGGNKLDVLRARMKAANEFASDVMGNEKGLPSGTGVPKVLDNSTLKQMLLERMQLSQQISTESYREQEQEINRKAAIDAKWAEIEGKSDTERYEMKRDSLMELLGLARTYNQQEEADRIEHDVIMLDLEAEATAKRAQERYAQYEADLAGKGVNGDGYNADRLRAEEEYLKDKQKIDNDELLTTKQKHALIEQLERAHGKKLNKIKVQYYDAWLGKLAKISKEEIDFVQDKVGQFEQAFSNVGNQMDTMAQKEANTYRDKENKKIDEDEKRELARARSEQQRTAIHEKYAARREKAEEEATKRGRERVKEIFALQKAAGIASALISTYKGAAAAVEPPPVGMGPLVGSILAAATIASGLAQVAMISQQEMPKYAAGGYVSGPGGRKDDRITARLSNGEYVVNADATSRNRALLEAVNSGARITGGQAATAMLASRIESLEKALMSRPMQVSVPIGDSECRRIVNAGGKVIRKGAW